MKRQKKLTREDDCGEKTGAREVSQGGGMGGMEKVEKVGSNRTEIRSRLGPAPKPLPEDTEKNALRAASLGIPEERIAILCGFHGNAGGWQRLLSRNPTFARRLAEERVKGELNMVGVVTEAGNGWQGSAWVLERTRGYVARQQLEHSGPGGKALTIAHQVLAAVQHGERA
jgi:hypothetical protein